MKRLGCAGVALVQTAKDSLHVDLDATEDVLLTLGIEIQDNMHPLTGAVLAKWRKARRARVATERRLRRKAKRLEATLERARRAAQKDKEVAGALRDWLHARMCGECLIRDARGRTIMPPTTRSEAANVLRAISATSCRIMHDERAIKRDITRRQRWLDREMKPRAAAEV